MRKKDIIKLAANLHGHLSPGVALGIRMGEVGLKKLKLSRGDKRLFAVVETTLCLADGVQASTGCTPGHCSLQIEDFGKLAVCLARSDTNAGVRITLKPGVNSQLIDDWMMRKRRLSHEEEEKLVRRLLRLDESSFWIEEVAVDQFPKYDEAEITKCDECGELFIETKAYRRMGKTVCKACSGLRYYTCTISLTEAQRGEAKR